MGLSPVSPASAALLRPHPEQAVQPATPAEQFCCAHSWPCSMPHQDPKSSAQPATSAEELGFCAGPVQGSCQVSPCASLRTWRQWQRPLWIDPQCRPSAGVAARQNKLPVLVEAPFAVLVGVFSAASSCAVPRSFAILAGNSPSPGKALKCLVMWDPTRAGGACQRLVKRRS